MARCGSVMALASLLMSCEASTEPLDAATYSADASAVIDPCDVELSPTPGADLPPATCRGETLAPAGQVPTWFALWGERGQHRAFVYWSQAEITTGTNAELPFADVDGRSIYVDYFIPDGTMYRASSGTVALLHATKGHYAVSLNNVRFAELPGFRIDGAVGAMVQHYACPNCD